VLEQSDPAAFKVAIVEDDARFTVPRTMERVRAQLTRGGLARASEVQVPNSQVWRHATVVELPVDDPKRSTGHEQLRKALEHVARQTTAPPSPSIAQSGTHDVIDKVPTSPQ
jgi:hypothetical protein